MSQSKIQVEFVEDPFVAIGKEKYGLGDRKTFDAPVAQSYIDAGWAKNVETGEQGERVPGAKPLQVHNTVQPQAGE